MSASIAWTRKYSPYFAFAGAILIHCIIFSLFIFKIPFVYFPKSPSIHFLGSILKGQEIFLDQKNSNSSNDSQNFQSVKIPQTKKSSAQNLGLNKPSTATPKNNSKIVTKSIFEDEPRTEDPLITREQGQSQESVPYIPLKLELK